MLLDNGNLAETAAGKINKRTGSLIGNRSPLVLFIACLVLGSLVTAPVFAAITYLYDQNGNMTSDGTTCYEYNEANQLKKVKNCSNNQTIAEYVYDYQGNRLVKKTYSSGSLQKTTFSPNDGYETVKLASDGTTQNTSYYFVNDQLIAKKNPDGTKNYYHNDHLGSTNVLTSQTGTLVEETKYDPWGEVKTGGTKSKFLFTGQEKDLETSLNYYNARYYDSHIRRFTQPDDIIQNVYDPQSLNRYSYVNNNPLRYTDPTGHYIETALDIAFIGIDLNDIKNDPTNLWNWAALGGDIAGTALPGITGVGLGMKLVSHTGDAAKTITKADNAGKNALNVAKQYISKATKTTKLEYDPHAIKRMQERSISAKQVEKTVANNKPFSYFHKNEVKTGYYDNNTKIFIAKVQNKIITVINKVTKNYIQNLKNKKP